MKTAILLSTFNGEKYLKDQVNSILNQSYKNWDLYIRDDGSYDKTLEIIREFVEKDKRIHFIDDNLNRLRPKDSFFELLKDVEADVYFFCDQDDYWLKDKLKLMVNEIEKKPSDVPNVVYCNLQCVDQYLKSIDNNFNKLVGKLKGNSRFITNDMPGCVMAFNKSLRNLFINKTKNYDQIIMHDWWIALIAEFCGNIKFLDKRLVLYRQHGDNVIGAGSNGSIIKKIFQKGILKKQKELVAQTYLQTLKFKQEYSKDISDIKIKEILKDFILCKNVNSLKRYIFLKKNKFKSSYFLRTITYRSLFCLDLKSILNNYERK